MCGAHPEAMYPPHWRFNVEQSTLIDELALNKISGNLSSRSCALFEPPHLSFVSRRLVAGKARYFFRLEFFLSFIVAQIIELHKKV